MNREDLNLKPCPLCKRNQVRLVSEVSDGELEVYVRCETCGVQGGRECPYNDAKQGMGLPDAFNVLDAFESAIDQAADDWNRRDD